MYRHWGQEELNHHSPSSFQLRAKGPPALLQFNSIHNQKFSDHERILILQLFKFFDLLSQKEYPIGKQENKDNNHYGLSFALNDPIQIIYPHLCSRSVAWISQTLTKERRFLSSVQFSDIQMLPMVWASSRNLDALIMCMPNPKLVWMVVALNNWNQNNMTWIMKSTEMKVQRQTCFSACSAGQPCTCLIRLSLKWAARVGVKEQEGRADEAFGGAEAELGTLLLLETTWLGPGEGLLWLLQSTQGQKACKHREVMFMKILLSCQKQDD